MVNWTPPKTWNNEVLTDGDLGTYVRDNTLYLHQNTSIRLATATVTAADTSSVTFAVPSGYRHHQIVFSGSVVSETARVLQLRFNGDSGDNYSTWGFEVNRAGALSGLGLEGGGRAEGGRLGSARTGGTIEIVSSGISSTFTAINSLSSYRLGASDANNVVVMSSGRWQSTSIVNSMTLSVSQFFNVDTSFSLYGRR